MLTYAKTVKYKAQCFSWQNEITNSLRFFIFLTLINFLIINGFQTIF